MGFCMRYFIAFIMLVLLSVRNEPLPFLENRLPLYDLILSILVLPGHADIANFYHKSSFLINKSGKYAVKWEI